MQQLLGKFSVHHKLLFQMGLAMLGMTLLALISLSALQDNLLQDRKNQTQHLVEAAHSILLHFSELAANGQMSAAQAKESAFQAAKALRYDENNYFWINDMQPRMVMHPFKPQLDGKDISSVKDPNGKRLFIEMVDVVRKSQAGFVAYQWPKPGADQPVDKISYVKGFKPWGWIIGSGVYVDDVSAIFWQQSRWVIGISVVFSLLILIFSMLIKSSVVAPIRALDTVITKVTDRGDLSLRVDISSQDELGHHAKKFNTMLEKLENFLLGVDKISQNLNRSANDIANVSKQTEQVASQQRADTEQVATAMNQMSASIQNVAQNAVNASESAQHASQKSQEGAKVVKSAVESINLLATEVESASQVVHQLEEEASSIGGVLEVIRGIAEQTNLLALNAAIEAARAGDQGRGFAVVADEVRTLAQRTQESTQEIQTMIESIQVATHAAAQAMEKGRDQTLTSVNRTEAIGEALDSIVTAVIQISELNTQIASASEEQSAVSGEINSNIVNINQLAVQTSDSAVATAESSTTSQQLASDLNQLAKQFSG